MIMNTTDTKILGRIADKIYREELISENYSISQLVSYADYIGLDRAVETPLAGFIVMFFDLIDESNPGEWKIKNGYFAEYGYILNIEYITVSEGKITITGDGSDGRTERMNIARPKEVINKFLKKVTVKKCQTVYPDRYM